MFGQGHRQRGYGPGGLGLSCSFCASQGATFTRPPPPPPNPLRSCPIQDHHRDLCHFTIIHHPNTEAGLTAYQMQVTDWHRANPNGAPDEQHPFPLIPGTAPLSSCECYDCRHQSHMQGAPPPVCAGLTLPTEEHLWRQIAGFIEREFNKRERAQVQQVQYVGYYPTQPSHRYYDEYQQYSFDRSYQGEVDDLPGNGEGPFK